MSDRPNILPADWQTPDAPRTLRQVAPDATSLLPIQSRRVNPWKVAVKFFVVLSVCFACGALGYLLVSGLLDGLPGPHDVLRVGGRP